MILVSAVTRDLSAQLVQVATQLDDDSGVITSAVSAAFRALGDVAVVSTSENPDYIVKGNVFCQPQCEGATAYFLVLRLSEPLRRSVAQAIADSAFTTGSTGHSRKADSLAGAIWQLLQGYEETHRSWTATLFPSDYDVTIKEIVANIDTRCLDKLRALRRMYRSSGGRERYDAFLKTREWIC